MKHTDARERTQIQSEDDRERATQVLSLLMCVS